MSGNRKGPQPEQQRDYGTADCIDCGRHTPRRLMAHIPHICTECLFPVFYPVNMISSQHRLPKGGRVRSPG